MSIDLSKVGWACSPCKASGPAGTTHRCFSNTTRAMADEVAAECEAIQTRVLVDGTDNINYEVTRLARAVEKLAKCVARRFPGEEE